MAKMMRGGSDNHCGPMFEEVSALFPDAVRFHWFQNAFDPNHRFWHVGRPIECGGGPGMEWLEVPLEMVEAMTAIIGAGKKFAKEIK